MGAKTREERLFGAACLKVTLEARPAAEQAIYQSALADLGLTDEDVQTYLAEHRDVVQAALASHGAPRN